MTATDRNFEYHPAAIVEAAEAYEWYGERSSQASENFWSELIRARALVADQPDLWPPYFHGTRVFRFRNFPYGLVYVRQDSLIIGLAVAHLRRRPGYWRQRLTTC